MHPKKTLYISDLDGTLLNPESQISSYTANALNRLIGQGMLFSIATARTPATVVSLMKEINIALPVVLMTGALIYDIRNNTYLSISAFNDDVVADLLNRIAPFKEFPMIYYIDHSMLNVAYRPPLSEPERLFMQEREGTPYKKFIAVGQATTVPKQTVLVLFMGEYAKLEQIRQTISSVPGQCSYLYHDIACYEQGFLEIYPAGTSKAEAIKQLASFTQADEIVVFGDNRNDLPMFEAAHRSCAVNNAMAEVKAQATHIIASNAENGVARFLERVFNTDNV